MYLWNIANGSSARESEVAGKSQSGLADLATSSDERVASPTTSLRKKLAALEF
jgi:hypothetical protein